MKLLEKKALVADLPGLIRLDDLKSWKEKARHHQRVANQKYLSLLGMTKEKCYREGTPPNQDRCDDCLASHITEKQIYKQKEVCLPRIMGLAIDKEFDGIHHGQEIADVKYEDSVGDTSVKLGIHLKSRTRSRPKGLGRGTYPIKSLYTQTFYSAYQALQGDIDFDAIGISIPNTIKENVVASIQQLLNNLGFSMLVVEEVDWLKIFDAALEAVVFDEEQA